ncbi:hypothetical protein EDB83DRAFT_1296908 [Lactarius deliciosus]|nr:hypothetical protein EDB83DRAFT_1296908 [Lactarius deliciosus]
MSHAEGPTDVALVMIYLVVKGLSIPDRGLSIFTCASKSIPLIFFLPLLFFRSSLSLPSRVDSRLQSLRPFLEITLFDRVHTLHSLGGISALFFLSKLTLTALLSLNF